jgi:hypothetical protein
VQQGALTDTEFLQQKARASELIDGMIPAWMSYRIGVGSSFIAGVGIVGSTFV